MSFRRIPIAGQSIVVLAALAIAFAAAPRAHAATTLTPSADASVAPGHPKGHYGKRGWLRVGGRAGWRSYLVFSLPPGGSVGQAVLQFTAARRPPSTLEVHTAKGAFDERTAARGAMPRIGRAVATWSPKGCAARRCAVSIDVTKAARPGRTLTLVLVARGRQVLRLASREARGGGPRLLVDVAPAASRPAPAPVAPAPAAPGPSGAAPTGPVAGVWTTSAELSSRPMSSPSWKALKAAADGSLGTASIADQNSDHDILTLAAALVYSRTGVQSYRAKAASGIAAAIGTEQGGRVLALGRNLPGYVAAADLIGLGTLDPALDARFRSWLSGVRTETLDGDTLIAVHERRPNNWGTMAGGARMAADVYLGDQADLDKAAQVFRGWLGDRGAYAGFDFGDTSWQADPSNPVPVQPPGASKGGLNIDGALADDMRRGCAFQNPPCHTNYAWEAMQGAVVQAQILYRRGYDSWNWSSRAMLRAAQFLQRLDQAYGGWWAASDDEWQPWVLNRAYGAGLPETSPAQPGKTMGWTDWSLG